MKRTESDKQASRDRLLEILKPGDTVYTILKHVSRSGMQRRIDLYAIVDGRPYWLSGHAACIMGRTVSDKGGIVVNGCGMDMGFDLVYNLSCNLFCPNHYEHDAAYALKQEWM